MNTPIARAEPGRPEEEYRAADLPIRTRHVECCDALIQMLKDNREAEIQLEAQQTRVRDRKRAWAFAASATQCGLASCARCGGEGCP